MSLTKRQLQALQENAPSAADLLGDNDEVGMGLINELNGEIQGSYDQEDALDLAAKEGLELNPFEETMSEATVDEKKEDPFALDQGPDLAEELAAVERTLAAERAARADEEPAEDEAVVKTQEELIRDKIMEMLESTPGAPSLEQIEKLKQRQDIGPNGIQVVALGESDIYIFTHLKRSQWKMIQEAIAKMAQSETLAAQSEDKLKENVVRTCVLWPQGVRNMDASFVHNSRAGVIDTLFELIMLHSYFLSPQQAMQLTISL